MPHRHAAFFSSHRATSAKRPRFAVQVMGSDGIIEITTGYLPSVKYLPDPSWSPGQSGAKWQASRVPASAKPEPLTDEGGHGGNRRAGVTELLAAIRDNRQPNGSIYDAGRRSRW